MVQDIEGFGTELETESFGNLEILKHRDVGRPVAGAHKSISAEISHTAQARRGKKIAGEVEAVGPLGMRSMHIVGERIGPVIVFAVEVVVTAHVHAIGRIKGG